MIHTAAQNRVSQESSFFKVSRCQFEGSLRFGFVSLLVYADGGLRRTLDVPASWPTWLLWSLDLLVHLARRFSLKPLVVQTRAKRSFWRWFSLAFFTYAASWMASYFTLRHSAGEWLGSLTGTAALGLVLAAVFGAWNRYPRITLELFVAHSAGYFLGEWLHHSLHGKIGMLLWGVCYGLGFGLGLARALYFAQTADGVSTAQTAD